MLSPNLKLAATLGERGKRSLFDRRVAAPSLPTALSECEGRGDILIVKIVKVELCHVLTH